MADHFVRAAVTHTAEALCGPLQRCMHALCPDLDDTAIERRPLNLSPRELATALPSLGKLLYLSRSQCDSPTDVLAPGLLTDTMELMPLLQFRQLQAVTLIDVEGPYEWIECQDRHGHVSARLYLLPDSDYLAWDGLHAQVDSSASAALAWPIVQFGLNRARIVQFRQRNWAGMQLLGAETCMCISAMGCRVATQIVCSEVAFDGRVERR